jgi:DNA repair protein RadD
MQLRDYQIQATQAVYNWFAHNKEGNPLVVLPPGSGKSVCMAELIRSAIQACPTQRILSLVNVQELIQQNHDKLKALYPAAPAGIYSAGIGIKEPRKQIVFAGIQTARNKAPILGYRDLIIVDECDSIPNKQEGVYHAFLDQMRQINPKLRIVGYTATPFRMKGGHLLNGDTFHDIAFEVPIKQLIDQGYLCPVYTKAPEDKQVSMDGVRVTHGEYNQKAMEQRYMEGDVTALALRDAMNRSGDRKCYLVFCAGVDHAKMVHEMMQDMGMKGNVVCDKTHKTERAESIENLRNGKFDYLTNNAILTTGTDIPRVDCIIILRSMRSRRLYIQIVGRETRLHPDKQYALLLDYGGNVDRFGAIDQQPEGRKAIEDAQDRGAPFKRCNEDNVDLEQWNDEPCGGISHAKAVKCEICGAPFIEKEKHGIEAAHGALITPDIPEPEEWEVTKVVFSVHFSNNTGKETLKISYYKGLIKICDEYKGLQKIYYTMQGWFNGEKKSFATIQEAKDYCQTYATIPIAIKTISNKDNKKYLQVIGYGFATA